MKFNLNYKRVLLLKLQGIGDTVLLLPIIYELLNTYPHIHLDICTGNMSSEELLKLFKFKIRHIFTFKPGIFNYLKLILNLILKRYYIVLLPYKSGKKGNLTAFLTLCPRRIGYAYKKDWKEYYWKLFDFLINYSLVPDINKHDIILNFELIRNISKKEIKIKPFFPNIMLNLYKDVKNQYDEFLKKGHIKNYILFHFGAGDPNRLWSLENYIKLISRILEKYKDYKIVLIGQGYENLLNARVVDSLKNNRVIQLTNPSFIELLYIIKKSVMVIGNDSGIMHLASLLNKVVISLWGYTDYKHTSPIGNKVYVIRKDLSCSPCYKVLLPIHCIYNDKKCLSQISVEDVWSIFKKIIENNKVKSERLITGTHIINI